jgi:hypothetical protein
MKGAFMPSKSVSRGVWVPGSKLLRLAENVGWFLIGVGMVLGFLVIGNAVMNLLAGQIVYDQHTETYMSCATYDGLPDGYTDHSGGADSDCEPESTRSWLDDVEWYHILSVLFVGGMLIVTMSRLRRRYFEAVSKDEVVDKTIETDRS